MPIDPKSLQLAEQDKAGSETHQFMTDSKLVLSRCRGHVCACTLNVFVSPHTQTLHCSCLRTRYPCTPSTKCVICCCSGVFIGCLRISNDMHNRRFTLSLPPFHHLCAQATDFSAIFIPGGHGICFDCKVGLFYNRSLRSYFALYSNAECSTHSLTFTGCQAVPLTV